MTIRGYIIERAFVGRRVKRKKIIWMPMRGTISGMYYPDEKHAADSMKMTIDHETINGRLISGFLYRITPVYTHEEL